MDFKFAVFFNEHRLGEWLNINYGFRKRKTLRVLM
ncbi:hypothetical protein CI610_02950 [invertebrate metagenome]|uniref:Uncharacterized protein n=1 Tax=invertebrate metagenome TaxID=1711999 RepID=A0A2H9T4I3_9ZZZZ